jgi:hypothetical protein
MVYLVASLASIVMLAAGLSVIWFSVRANHGRILGALLGQPVDPMMFVYAPRQRAWVKVSVQRPMQPLRAAA